MAAWSQLPNDILGIIGEKLGVGIDRIRFRSVCRTWRSVLPFPQPPWLMLAEDHTTPNTRGFFGLGRSEQGGGAVYQFELPEVYQFRCVGSTGTWLIITDGSGSRVRLLNPFTRRQFDLPQPLNLIKELEADRMRDYLLKKAVLSSPPSSPSCIAIAIHHPIENLAFARPGDASWTPLKVETPRGFRGFFQDVIFYQNQFYAINAHRMLAVCDLNETHPKVILITDYRKELDAHLNQHYYLVEWTGELLLVVKYMDDLYDDDDYPVPHKTYYKLDRFEVYKFDFTRIEWTALEDLGGYSLFMGFNTSVAVLASNYPGLKNNCIYFTDDYTWGYLRFVPGGRSMGVFDLGDSSITPHYPGISTSPYSPPLWIVP